jgi:hypothetical protein
VGVGINTTGANSVKLFPPLLPYTVYSGCHLYLVSITFVVLTWLVI